jgi:hypothetical protein
MNAAAATITAGRQSIPPRKSSKITADVKVRLIAWQRADRFC